MRADVPRARVQVVALVPAAGPVPPPSIEVMPDISASSTCCGQMKWMWRIEAAGGENLPFAGNGLGSGPITMVTPGWMSGLPLCRWQRYGRP